MDTDSFWAQMGKGAEIQLLRTRWTRTGCLFAALMGCETADHAKQAEALICMPFLSAYSAYSAVHRIGVYTLYSSPQVSGAGWTPVAGQADVPGTGGLTTLIDTNAAPAAFYRIGVRAP